MLKDVVLTRVVEECEGGPEQKEPRKCSWNNSGLHVTFRHAADPTQKSVPSGSEK